MEAGLCRNHLVLALCVAAAALKASMAAETGDAAVLPCTGSTHRECLTNMTISSGCAAAGPIGSGMCGATGGEVGGLYGVVRRQGVEPANKELLGFEHAASVVDCEARCERNCSCWGAIYSNKTGYCYLMDYPAQMLVVSGESKVGYFGGSRAKVDVPSGFQRGNLRSMWLPTWQS